MALVSAQHDPSPRRRVFAVYIQHGVAGALVFCFATIFVHNGEPVSVDEAATR